MNYDRGGIVERCGAALTIEEGGRGGSALFFDCSCMTGFMVLASVVNVSILFLHPLHSVRHERQKRGEIIGTQR